ncbi:hypothetical protein M2323_002639 [Rhodoblastus acidophilus]|nr:hypothetical protein [Rhodoblastus acidophilus]MCW2333705.1 hypothetical protein [Rhodoblastus acidophilus]
MAIMEFGIAPPRFAKTIELRRIHTTRHDRVHLDHELTDRRAAQREQLQAFQALRLGFGMVNQGLRQPQLRQFVSQLAKEMGLDQSNLLDEPHFRVLRAQTENTY